MTLLFVGFILENHHENFKAVIAVIAVIIVSFLWGTTGIAASYLPNVNALAIGAFSTGVGGILLLISARKKLLVDYKRLLEQSKLLLLSAASIAIYLLAFYTSMRLSGVAIGTLVSIGTAPFFAAIFERLISQKSMSLQWLLSFIISAIGIVLLMLGRDQSINTDYSTNQQSMGVILGWIGVALVSLCLFMQT